MHMLIAAAADRRVRGSEGKTNCMCKVDSQVILFDGRGGGLPGSRQGGQWRRTEALLHPQDPGLESGD